MFLTYNGVNLALTSIDRVHRDTVFSDDGTTVLYVETTLSVSAVYHPPIGGVPDLGGTSVAGRRRNKARRVNINSAGRPTIRGSDPGGGPGIASLYDTQNAVDPKPKQQDLEELQDGKTDGAGTLQAKFGKQDPPNDLQAAFQSYPGLPPAILTSGTDPRNPTSCSLPDPGAEGWAGPIDTDRELELRLRTPRKKLAVWGWDKSGQPLIWIESPRRAAPCDAKSGPVTLNCSVRGGPNGNSMFVGLDIRTWLSPCEDGSDRPVLSHRWQMVHTEDENHYLTRLIRGTVVFDVGNLLEAHQNPDWFRRQMFHPIPLGFKRTLGPIALSPDGSTLSYEYADTDQTVVFDAADTGATQMHIVEQVHYYNPYRAIS